MIKRTSLSFSEPSSDETHSASAAAGTLEGNADVDHQADIPGESLPRTTPEEVNRPSCKTDKVLSKDSFKQPVVDSPSNQIDESPITLELKTTKSSEITVTIELPVTEV